MIKVCFQAHEAIVEQKGRAALSLEVVQTLIAQGEESAIQPIPNQHDVLAEDQ